MAKKTPKKAAKKKPAPDKVDLFALHKDEYAMPKTPQIVTAGKGRYLVIEGRGRPGSDSFQAAIGALYSIAWTIKMTKKFAGEGDFKVCPLECLYWTAEGKCGDVPLDEFSWRLMIRIPDFVKAADLRKAAKTLKEKGKTEPVDAVKIGTLAEGRCAQVLQVGPYEKAGETAALLQEFAGGQGLAFNGPYHEIYLSDPRRVAPERLRTIARVPVGRA